MIYECIKNFELSKHDDNFPTNKCMTATKGSKWEVDKESKIISEGLLKKMLIIYSG